jgi:thioredoxin-like negative regulator of GroEL
MQEGRYTEALPVLQQALAKLNGTGDIYEAYADYNMAYTLIQLGRCSEAPALLDESEQIQGFRHEIAQARHDADKCLRKQGKRKD